MVENSTPSIRIDLNEFKLHLHLKGRTQLTLHFNSPSRSFYLSVIALVVNEMKKLGKIKSIPLHEHLDLLALLNETVGCAAGSSDKENLLQRIYRKWKGAISNLEEAPLFKVLGKKKEEGEGVVGKVYSFTEAEKDGWANLFEYMGSEENVRLKFAIDKIGVGLNETSIIFGDSRNGEAWDQFIASLKKEKGEKKEEAVPAEQAAVPELFKIPFFPPQQRKISWIYQYRWVLLIVVIGVVAGAIWRIYLGAAPIEVASLDRMKYPLPDGPSIAVLPFVNMSEDPKQEFLCDGLTEEIITALSRIPGLFVIARNSTFTYKGKPVKYRQVSEELGVRYVLGGSVRKSGDRLRVTIQLVDALAGHHVWTERYDRELKDLFALQDEITIKVLDGVQVKLVWGGDLSTSSKFAEKYYRGKQGLDCYLKLVEARGTWLRGDVESNNQARRMIEEAIAMCPENPMGYAFLGWVHHNDYSLGNTNSPGESLEKAIELAQKALALEDSSAARVLLCNCYYKKGELGKAIDEGERAVALDPGNISALRAYAFSLSVAGRPEEAIPIFQKAIRLSPFANTFLYRDFGFTFRNKGSFEEAVSAFKKAIQVAPDDMIAHLGLTGVYVIMGQEKEARAEAAEVLRINPKYSMDSFAKSSSYKDQSEAEKVDIVLRKAGIAALSGYALTLRAAGRYEEAILISQKAIRLSPGGPSYLYRNLAGAFRNAGRYEEATSAFKKAIQIWPDDLSAHSGLTATYIMFGREKEARAEAAEVLRINPKFSVDSWVKNLPFKQSEKEKIDSALRKAGLK